MSLITFSWIEIIIYPHLGLTELFLGAINSAVHIGMYSYYLLSSFDTFKGFVKVIKPAVTIMQLIQFILILVHCIIAVLPGCAATKLFYIQFPNVFLLLFMFGKFFVRSYMRKKSN